MVRLNRGTKSFQCIQRDRDCSRPTRGLDFQQGISNAKENKLQIKNLAQRVGSIALTYEQRAIVQGWGGKPKGMEQTLWEQDFIDPSQNCKVYSVNGTKDLMGAVRKDTSLWHLMSNLKAFKSQETMLQLKATEMGILIDWMPNGIASLRVRGSSMVGDALRITTDDNLWKTREEKTIFVGLWESVFQDKLLQQREYDSFRSEPEHTFCRITRYDKSNSPIRHQLSIRTTQLPLLWTWKSC